MKTFNGIGIQHKNGRIYTMDGWERRHIDPAEARGIAIGNGEYSLCLYKNALFDVRWSSQINIKIDIDGFPYTVPHMSQAIRDFNGKENTDAILKAVESGIIKDAPAAQWSRSLGEEWYLPAAGELMLIIDNSRDVENCLAKIDGTAGDTFDQYPWSSTQYSATYAWRWDCFELEPIRGIKNYGQYYHALACAAL